MKRYETKEFHCHLKWRKSNPRDSHQSPSPSTIATLKTHRVNVSLQSRTSRRGPLRAHARRAATRPDPKQACTTRQGAPAQREQVAALATVVDATEGAVSAEVERVVVFGCEAQLVFFEAALCVGVADRDAAGVFGVCEAGDGWDGDRLGRGACVFVA